MESNDNNKIYIPYGIKIEKEIINGFGKKEMKHFLICILITVVVSLFLFLITQNPLVVVVSAVTGFGAGFIFSRREAYSQSVIGIIKSIVAYHRTQQKFEFIYRNSAMKNKTETQEYETSSPILNNKTGGENAEYNDNGSSGSDSRAD